MDYKWLTKGVFLPPYGRGQKDNMQHTDARLVYASFNTKAKQRAGLVLRAKKGCPPPRRMFAVLVKSQVYGQRSLIQFHWGGNLKSFKWCGNYCGPGYCSGKMQAENNCDFEAPALNKYDRCCLDHDRCCDSPDAWMVTDHDAPQMSCNARLLQCPPRIPAAKTGTSEKERDTRREV